MYRLEHGEADRSTLKKALPTLSHIQEAQNAWKDDFALNSMLRKRFRVSRAPAWVRTMGRQRGPGIASGGAERTQGRLRLRFRRHPTTSQLQAGHFSVSFPSTTWGLCPHITVHMVGI